MSSDEKTSDLRRSVVRIRAGYSEREASADRRAARVRETTPVPAPDSK